MKNIFLLGISCVLLAGCSTRPADLGREPGMTPVGAGLGVQRTPVPHVFKQTGASSLGSTWSNASADLFTSSRAKRVGDIVTVNIQIDEKAEFENATDRSRNSNIRTGFDYGLQFKGWQADGTADGGVRSASSTDGKGTIDRREKMRLSVAAVVTEVLPNGNAVISGSQEIRVNFEVRVLNVAGIVHPGDITKRNTISYDRIAEARASYGGRGRLSEVQQPAWGQQVYDAVAPF